MTICTTERGPRALAWFSLLCVLACGREAPGRNADSTSIAAGEMAAIQPDVVDSARTLDEDRRRFEEMIGPRPAGLSGGGSSRDALVETFLSALAAADTGRLRATMLTAEEFGHLIYPHSAYTRAPYRQAPEVVWLQLSQQGSKGLTRLLRPDFARSLRVAGYRCPSEPITEGATRLWRGCYMRVVRSPGDMISARLFGAIIELDRHFKFVTLDTDF